MRKSITAGLTLSAAVMAFAGQSQAYVNHPECEFGRPCIQNAYGGGDKGAVIEMASMKDSKSAKPAHARRKPPAPAVVEIPESSFRIPAHPIVRDCVHVFFPQCSTRSGLNDGTFGLPY
jgi:hypothetical protein